MKLWMVRFLNDGSRWEIWADTMDCAHAQAIALCEEWRGEKRLMTGAAITRIAANT